MCHNDKSRSIPRYQGDSQCQIRFSGALDLSVASIYTAFWSDSELLIFDGFTLPELL